MSGPEPFERSRRSELGIATIWSLTWLFVAVTVGFVGMMLAVAVAGQHHVDSSADLVALSAADSLQHGSDPCQTARAVAVANRVELADCRVDAADVVVTVRTRIPLFFGLQPQVVGHARAGPG
jgi:secretion/DNA translocation related TadE-like protein